MKYLDIYRKIRCASTKQKYIFVFALLITLSVCSFALQAHAGPAPIQTFFVPLSERQVQRSLEAVDTGDDDIGNVMRSMVSIAATGDNTIIYYDHWEDGYELDLANPVQASTEIWGDNDPTNGIPPGFGTDVINAGDVISLDNTVSLPRNPSQIRYDGRDKFGGTRAAAVTRASWAVSPGVVLAGAVEVYPVRDYGLRFEVPVGEDLGSDEMFEYVSLMVLAAEDGTDIQIDIDGNGTTDITQTLNQGESYQVDGGIDTGASVTASKPVQAHIFTGDIGARFESRFYTLYPVENWSDSYYSPVGTAADGDETYVFAYNPNSSAITVNYDTRIGSGSFAVPAGSTNRYLMPSMSGAHFFSGDGSPFFAIATVGADPGANLVHDWGFSLLPESYLTPMAVVGWGPGSDDLSENGSPVWVTAVAAATVYVDYDGDPATGPLVDANGDRYNVALNLAMLESARVYDNTDNDQTGMRLYTLDGTLITAAWGQDPANSEGGAPYLDLGTSVLPFPIASVEKTSALVVDDDSNGLVDWGDTIEYTITVNNDGVVILGGVVALDPLPAGVTYVPGSTTLNGAPVADETVPPATTEYPLDEGGLSMPVIPPTGFSTITFQVTVDFGTITITNSVSINTDQEILTSDDVINVNTPAVTACSLDFTDTGGVSQAVYLENSDIFVTVDDNDQNTDAGSIQSFAVVVVNADGGDVETMTLIETGNDTGVFRNSTALPSSDTGGMSDEDGTLYAMAGNTAQVAYTDPVFGDTCSDTAGISIPTEIKPLYLSEPGQSMDRVDPVATGDSTTAISVELSASGTDKTTFTQSPAMCQDFVIPTGGAVTVTNYINVSPSNGSVTRSVAASSDDAEEQGPDGSIPGFMYLDSSDLELVKDLDAPSNGTQKIGLRFNNITVPPDATITNAYITFRALAPDAPNTNTGATNLTIEGQAADNPGTFPSTAYDISNRPRTTASAGWSPSSWTTGNDYDTPDLSTIAQELVNRSGWASGNSMVFIVTGSGSRSAESWNDPGINPPQLTIEYTTNSMPANPDISATIKHDGTTIETLTNPTVTDLGAGIYRLDWTDVISSDTTVLAGEQVELEIATAEAGVSFEILYDSSTYPSKIMLPTTTPIVINVDTLAAYDASYPGGSSITDAENGATLYLRATVSDPFGTDDITDLDLSISDPCGGGPINVTLDDGDVVATGSCSKTYGYVWNTTMCEGNYDIIAVANEGTEGITDSAAIRVTLSFTDTGTAGNTAFTDGTGNPVSNYNADATICVQVTDMDQNSNPAAAETVSAVVTSPQGDSETMTLTETGPNTGIFRACIASSITVPGAPDDGSLYALPGDVLVAGYTDPDDAGDTSDDTALVNTPAADMTLSKLLIDPVDGTAVVNDLIRFDIVVGSPGPTDLTVFTVTDTFAAGCMSYDAASTTPGSIGAGTLTWSQTELGTIASGSSKTISVWFTADTACAPATNSVSASGQDQFGTPVSAGPAAAQVTITDAALSVTKTLISPNPGPAYVGDPVTFRITLDNTGTTSITTLPLDDTFSAACYTYQSASIAPDGIGAGLLAWNNLGPLGVGASTSLDVTLTVSGECNPGQNTADVGFAVDENGDSVPAVQDSAGLQTIGAKIGDRVWNDRDGDGVQDAGEGGIANVIVFVDINDDGSRDAGEPYDTTDASGTYDITDLAAGSYTVRVDAATLPAGVVLTGGSNPLAVSVSAGEDFNTADFGYQGNASIGDFIWHDANSDGNQDGGEPGLGGVTVFLDVDSDGVLDAGEPFTVTDGSGNYDFSNLAAGNYEVDVDDTTLPPNYVLTTGAASLAVTLAAGEDYNDADFGYRQQGGVNGHLFDDVDGDGVQDAGEADLSGVDVIITDSNGDSQTVTTDAGGDYQAFLPPGATTLDVDDTTLPPNAFITTANDPQSVTVNAGAFTDSSDVGYQFGIPSHMKLRTGSYTGNGIAGTTVTGLGFEPNLVIIKVADDTKEGVMRTSSMTGDNSKPMGGATALDTDLIQSLDVNGFTIGADDRVNKDALTYHWIAFEAGDGEMVVDTYTGTGADNTSVSGVGFQPDYVMVLPAINKEPVHRSSAQSGDITMLFKNTASVTNHIQTLQADGFQVGDDDRVNKLNETYHYIAWKEVAGKMAVDSYDGNATDGTDISGLGFAPEYVIIKQDNAKEAVHRPDSLAGDNTLWFVNKAQSMDMIQQLQSDGFQIGLDDTVNAATETYFWAAFAGSHLTISSASDQAFYVNDPATVIRTITITEDNLDPTITAANDIRISIPAGFNMTWDTSITTASVGGMAAAKVATAVTYEDGDRTLVLNVTGDFGASDQITVSLLRFNNFTSGSPADNLELEVDNGDTVAAVDDKTITVVGPTISSAVDQYFIVGSPAKAIQTITITEDSYGPSITAGNDIRIRIPAGFNMTWDTSDTAAVIGGSAAGKVSTMVSYEDGGRTLVVDATSDFAAADQITISDLSFTDFTAASLPDNLELEVKDDGLTVATDDKTVAIGEIRISSADNQEFLVGDAAATISPITVTEDSSAAVITASNDIRIRIPDSFNMLWDTTDTAAVIGGGASAKVSTTVSYEDAGKTLVLNVTADFAPSDQITISGLSFSDFTATSFGDHLELEVFNDGLTVAEDDKFKAIGGEPSAGSMLVYGEGSVVTPRYRTWQGAPSLSFSAEASANNTDDVIKWVVLKPSPISNEMILGTYSSADKNLYIQTWDGSNWTSNWNTHLNYDGNERMFDIAYEKNSGDVVVVFGDKNDDSLRYRKRVGGTWDSSNQLVSGITLDNEANWVRAESRPGTDDIFVATSTESKSLYAARWNGTGNSWGDQIQTTASLKDQTKEGFDIGFESVSGDAFLIWGDDAKNVKYREFTTSWQTESTAYTLPSEAVWLAAAYDSQPTSSKIAIGMITNGNMFEFAAWNGSSWVTRPSAIDAPNRDNRFIDVAFESDTGEAVYGFTQDVVTDDKKKFAWRTWTSSGGFSSVTVENGLSNEIKFVQLKADPQSDDIMAVYVDKDKDLYYRYWDGSSWTALTAPLETELSDEDKNEAFMFAWKESPPTAIDLISFSATGQNATIQVAWQTAHEIDNLGFNLYRSASFAGPYYKINRSLVPGLIYSVMGQSYAIADEDVSPGQIYYYRLEDIDVNGTRTYHGPVCVDWDGDGLPDDWEIAYRLNPGAADANLDPDGDGLTNMEEYQLGTDPFNPDTDGDGIADGAEDRKIERQLPKGTRALTRGVDILAADESGITLELRTDAFETELVNVGGQEFESLQIPAYIHGYTRQTGQPRMPLKGILIDIPAGRSASLTVLETEDELYEGYQVYPVPENLVSEQGDVAGVGERFVWNQAAYAQDVFYPDTVAELGSLFTFRGQDKQQVMLYPLNFNPATGQIWLHRRIRLRLDYVDGPLVLSARTTPLPWKPPSGANPTGALDLTLANLPLGPYPFSPMLLALELLAQPVWAAPGAGLPFESTSYKISVAEEGIYRLTRSYLVGGGVDVDAIDLSQVRLYNLGWEVALDVYDQNGDDRLDSGDFIEFYGQAVPALHAKYVRENVYWLVTSGDSGSPLRMPTVDSTPAGGALAAGHLQTVRHEQDAYYVGLAPGADDVDRWYFASFVLGTDFTWTPSPVPVDFTIALPGVAGPADLKIRLWGYYDTDHEVAVWVNGTAAGTYRWRGIAFNEIAIDGLSLVEGDNTVTLACNTALDGILTDWFEVTYPRRFAAVDDTLKFAHDSGWSYTVTDFSTNEQRTYDITDPADVRRLVDFTSALTEPPTAPPTYTLTFEPPDSGQVHTYLALTPDAVKTPGAIVEDIPSDLGEASNAADYILITHRDLGWDAHGDQYPWLSDLAALREAQGLRVKVVDVADIFDEFGHGLPTPEAIRDFLSYAFDNWRPPAPRFVLLVGDTTYDYKDNFGRGTVNYVPSYLVFTEYMGETVTDEWFARISGDDAVPDLYIGRLTAASADDAAVMVDKIRSYENAANSKTWQKNVVLISDNRTEDYEAIFEAISDETAAQLPIGMNLPVKGYLNDYLAPADLNADIKSWIDAGALMVNYSGHASLQRWAAEGIFQNSDVAELTNAGRYPFVVNMSCLTGYFAYLDPYAGADLSLAEAMLQADGQGAVAALMPTGMTPPEGQQVLEAALVEAIFSEDLRQLGPAISTAKQTLLANGGQAFEELSETFLLFGDPALNLKVPLPRRPTELVAEGQITGIFLQWQPAADCNGVPVAGYHLYRSLTPTSDYTRVNIKLIVDTQYEDPAIETEAADDRRLLEPDTAYYYTVAAVAADGDQSVQSEMVSAMLLNPPADTGKEPSKSGGGNGGGGCFVSTAQASEWSVTTIIGLFALIGLLWLGKKGCFHKFY